MLVIIIYIYIGVGVDKSITGHQVKAFSDLKIVFKAQAGQVVIPPVGGRFVNIIPGPGVIADLLIIGQKTQIGPAFKAEQVRHASAQSVAVFIEILVFIHVRDSGGRNIKFNRLAYLRKC